MIIDARSIICHFTHVERDKPKRLKNKIHNKAMKAMKATNRPMKNGKIDEARRAKIVNYIQSDLHLVKKNGYTLIFDPSESGSTPPHERRIVFTKHTRRGVMIYGYATDRDLQEAEITS